MLKYAVKRYILGIFAAHQGISTIFSYFLYPFLISLFLSPFCSRCRVSSQERRAQSSHADTGNWQRLRGHACGRPLANHEYPGSTTDYIRRVPSLVPVRGSPALAGVRAYGPVLPSLGRVGEVANRWATSLDQ